MLAVEGNRDLPGLLGHDDRDGVVLLGQADRRAVPRAELAAQHRLHRQRQEAGGGGNAALLDDDRAVVQRRRRLEDADQQVVGHLRVERNAALDVVAQADLALEHDDRPLPARRQQAGRDDDLFDRLGAGIGLGEGAEEAARGRSARARGGCRTGTARCRRTRRSRPCCGSASSRSAAASSSRRRTAGR